MTETITWVPVTDRLPDDDMSVLVVTSDCSEPVWIGYRNDGEWVDTDGVVMAVTHWAEMPEGPATLPAKEE